MKIALKIVIAILVNFLLIIPAQAAVEGQEFDQVNDSLQNMSCSDIKVAALRVQTFKPSLNRVLAVDFYLSERSAGEVLTLTIKKESDGSVVGQDSHELPHAGASGWETFSFNDPYVTVVPEETYGLYLEDSGSDTKICFGTNEYARGELKGFPQNDMFFSTIGKNVVEAAAPVVTPAPVSNTNSNSAAPSSRSNANSLNSNNSNNNNENSNGDIATPTSNTTAESDTVNSIDSMKKTGIWIGIIGGIIIVAGIITLILLRRKNHKNNEMPNENKEIKNS